MFLGSCKYTPGEAGGRWFTILPQQVTLKGTKVSHLTAERPPETTPSSFSRRRAFLLLAAYGVFLFLTNPWVTTFEDEATFIDQARTPVAEMLTLFLKGGAHAHPPLPDILLHLDRKSVV